MLTIYKSSAGAGKTFTLAGNYIDLLFSSAQRNAHRHILAVTFTKKATAEMKSRIIKELALLAKAEKSDHKERLQDKFKLSDEQLQKRAASILTDLLQDYGRFMVSTIDSFFQQIIRSFARELNLPGSYNIELDSSRILQTAVDDYFYNLPLDLNDESISALMSVVTENIENSDNWNPKNTILELSKELLKETYQANQKHLTEVLSKDSALIEYRKKTDAIYFGFKQELRNLEKQVAEIVANNGIEEKQLKGALTPFHWEESKVASKIGEELPANTRKLIANTLTKDNTLSEVCQQIAPLAERLDQLLHSKYAEDFLSARAIRRYLPYLVILQDVQKYISKANAELNRLPISETNLLLYEVLSEAGNSPFIYEKTGERISNYMIDEFQDTSSMQWRDFRPLIDESNSRGKENMLVGDVKQSIYRWRNSDSSLLQSEVDRQFGDIEHESLLTNYRTDKIIVEENNKIFKALAKTIQNEYQSISGSESNLITEIYKDVEQKIHKQEEGYFRIEFVDIEKKDDRHREIIDKLPNLIKDLTDRGIQAGKIAILIRNNKDASSIADTLLKNDIQVMSNEGLYLNSCTAVKLIIHILQLSLTPEDKILQLQTKYEYGLCNMLTETDALNAALRGGIEIPEVEVAPTLPEYVMNLITRLQLATDSTAPYLQGFSDLVYQYESKYPTDIYSFLEWWEQTGCNTTLTMESNPDAVQIVTIHKSKGLEYEAVIIPFCDWETSERLGGGDIMWLTPKDEKFSGMPLVPIKYERALLKTIFKEDYINELQKLYIDNLNLTYVAFTRPKRELYVFAAQQSYRTKNMGAALYQMMTTAKNEAGEHLFTLDDNVYERGSKVSGNTEKTSATDSLTTTAINQNNNTQIKIKLPSRNYFENATGNRLNTNVNIGLMMHDLLCKVVKRGDEQHVAEQMVREGRLTKDDRLKVETEIRMFQELTADTDWFDEKWKVVNERDILLPDGNIRRPDRVMIAGDEAVVVDWKFGMKKRDEYNVQVKEYMQLLQKMGYNTKGYLCYVNLKEIEQI